MSKKELDLMTRKKIILAYAKRYQRATSKKEVVHVGNPCTRSGSR